MDTGKEKGYVLYDEVNELLTEDYPGGRELDDLLTELDSAGVEILEEPKLEFDKKLEDGEELVDLELAQDFSDKTNDPVRMYLREMGTVPLLTREGEIELAKRIERGQAAVRKALSPLRAGDSRNSGAARAAAGTIRRGPRHPGDAGPGGHRREYRRAGRRAAGDHRRNREALQEGPAVPPEAASHLARDEAQDAPLAALESGAHHGR